MTSDFQSTLDAIDEVAVHRCGHCDAPLGPEAPSGLFCGAGCQAVWNRAHGDPLVGYREPVDLPQHVDNLVELESPETTASGWGWPEPRWSAGGLAATWAIWDEVIVPEFTPPQVGDLILVTGPDGLTWSQIVTDTRRGPEAEITYELTADTSPFDRAIRECAVTLANATGVPIELLGDWTAIGCVDPAHVWGRNPSQAEANPDPRQRALEARRNRNTGPRQSQRAPRRIDPRRSR